MEARVLGALEIHVEGERVDVRGGKQRELLAILLVRANEVVSADRLIDALWGETPPPSALKTLQALVSRLRSNLGSAGGALETHGQGYRLRIEPGRLDAEVFRTGLEEGRRLLARGEPEAAAERLGAALALWRGPALAEFRYEDFAQVEIARLDELRLEAQEDRVEADLALGRHAEVVVELEALVAEQPLRERPRGQLMLALYRSGRQAEALRVFQQGRHVLAEELGLEPSESLRQLERRILDQDPAIAAPERPARVGTAARSARRPLLLAATAAIVLVLAIGAALVRALDGGEEVERAGALALDPDSGELLASVPLGTAPSAVAVGEGGVWVVDADDRTVSQIDPETRSVVRTFSTSSTPTDIVAGAGAIWIGNAPIGTRSGLAEGVLPASISRLDPETGLVAATIALPPAPGGHVYGAFAGATVRRIAVSPDAVWVINRDLTISRIDPRSNRIVARIDGVKAFNIAAGDGDVWVAHEQGAEERGVAEIDPSTNAIARRVKLDVGFVSALAVGGGAVWAADPEGGNVWRIDTGRTPTKVAIPLQTWVADVSFGEGAVWATNEIADTIHRIDPRTNTARRIVGATSPRGIDAADGAVWVTTASPPSQDASLPPAVCRDVDYGRDGTPDLLLVSSLPLQGQEREFAQSTVDGIRHVLESRRYEAGAYTVGFQSCDSSTAQSGQEDFFRCGTNAKAFARNLRVVGVIGSYFSFCSYAQIPITNQADGGPLAMMSPSNTHHELTEDDTLYPSGTRSFFRLAAPERDLGVAQIELARQLGHDRLFLLTSTHEEYGASYPEGMRRHARRAGVDIVGSAAFDPEAESLSELVRRVVRSRPQSVAIVGLLTPGTGTMIRDLRTALGPEIAVSAPDAFVLPDDLRKLIGAAATGMYIATYGIPNDRLPSRGKQLLERIASARGGDPGPDLAASYGAQAAEIFLDAIAQSDGTRESVTEQVRLTEVRNGILGDVAFDRRGDLAEAPITILRVGGSGLNVDRIIVVKRPRSGV